MPDSRFILLAARTSPDAMPRHAGISLFLVDLDSPGISASEHRPLCGDVSATTYWDDVFVPDDRLVRLVRSRPGRFCPIGVVICSAHALRSR